MFECGQEGLGKTVRSMLDPHSIGEWCGLSLGPLSLGLAFFLVRLGAGLGMLELAGWAMRAVPSPLGHAGDHSGKPSNDRKEMCKVVQGWVPSLGPGSLGPGI